MTWQSELRIFLVNVGEMAFDRRWEFLRELRAVNLCPPLSLPTPYTCLFLSPFAPISLLSNSPSPLPLALIPSLSIFNPIASRSASLASSSLYLSTLLSFLSKCHYNYSHTPLSISYNFRSISLQPRSCTSLYISTFRFIPKYPISPFLFRLCLILMSSSLYASLSEFNLNLNFLPISLLLSIPYFSPLSPVIFVFSLLHCQFSLSPISHTPSALPALELLSLFFLLPTLKLKTLNMDICNCGKMCFCPFCAT